MPHQVISTVQAIMFSKKDAQIISHLRNNARKKVTHISREMKIPCIVGTRNATDIFKDGDLVEVDADKGIVRKIDKSKK